MEKISAFVDGEIDAAEARGQIGRLKESAELRAAWETYHLIGDTLRGERQVIMPRSFTESVRARLATEPTVLAPRSGRILRSTVGRFALPVAASACGMALVAWLALFNNPFAPGRENVAKAPAPVHATATQLAADRQFNEYLWAHRQVSSSTPVPSVPEYVQTVSGQEAEEKR